MITKYEIFDLLLKACPSYEQSYKEYLEESYEPGDERLIYVELGEFSCYLVKLALEGQMSEFPAIFEVVEQLHIDGDDYVKEAATIGLLEGLQNVSGHHNLDSEFFYNYLRPESKRWWNRLNDFWSGKSPLV